MSGPQDIPQLTVELFEMSKEYVRQETLEPAKRLGGHAAMKVGAAITSALGALFLVFGLYALLTQVLPETEWYEVLARLLTAVGAAAATGIIVWRMQSDHQQG